MNQIKLRNLIRESIENLMEDINVPINVGDTVLGGKFKNKKIKVKDIDKNEKGDITINDKPLLRVRIPKEVNEVEYVIPTQDEIPKNISDNIRVFHGFNSFESFEKVLKKGLSGKETVPRVYSHHLPKELKGLFVTADFNFAKKYANGGIIIEFSVNINDLLPNDDSFKTGYDNISFKHSSQAIYTGDLDPNMIKYIWKFEDGKWNRFIRKDFINKFHIDTSRSDYVKYLPNDDFSLDDFSNTSSAINFFKNANEFKLKQMGFFPKQIDQIIKLKSDGFFNEKLNEGSVKKSDRVDIYRDNNYVVVRPLTETASCKYGAYTKWCISAPSSGAWDSSPDAIVIMIIQKKYSITPERQEIIDKLLKYIDAADNNEVTPEMREEMRELRRENDIHDFEDLSKIALVFQKNSNHVEIWDSNNININDNYQFGWFDLPLSSNVINAIENYIISIK